MKKTMYFLKLAAVTAAFASCEKSIDNEIQSVYTTADASRNLSEGYVYVLSNDPAGNELIVYNYNMDGFLTYKSTASTGGLGSGGEFSAHGTIVNNDDWILAVNPGSNTISTFKMHPDRPELTGTYSSGGEKPVSITMWNNLVYVVNAGTPGNIVGFTLMPDGSLQMIDGSQRQLSSYISLPAQISFVGNGKVLAITEKNTNKIITYTIENDIPSKFNSRTSANETPHGFAVGSKFIYVSEMANGNEGQSAVSQYLIEDNGEIKLINSPVAVTQTGSSTVVLANNRYLYSTNTGSNSISFFSTEFGLDLKNEKAGRVMSPVDATVTGNSSYMFTLNSGDETISAFRIGFDGSLEHIQTLTGLPENSAGLIAR